VHEIQGQRVESARLQNARYFVEVSAPLGRIIGFGYRGGPNLLWVNPDPPTEGYRNPGGDRLWPTIQPLWPRVYGGRFWPPDPILDGQPWTVTLPGPDRVIMQSRPQPRLGIVATRQLTLHPNRLEIRNTLVRVKPSIFPVCIWTNTQVPVTDGVHLHVDQQLPPAEPYVNLMAEPIDYGNSLIIQPQRVTWDAAAVPRGKIGTLGSTLEVPVGRATLRQTADFRPGGSYPDGSNLQVYRHHGYLEIETLGEMVHLEPGESVSHTVVWTLIDTDTEPTPP
jgi:hypothetical protein